MPALSMHYKYCGLYVSRGIEKSLTDWSSSRSNNIGPLNAALVDSQNRDLSAETKD